MKKLVFCLIILTTLSVYCSHHKEEQTLTDDGVRSFIKSYIDEEAPRFASIDNDGTINIHENIYVVNFLTKPDGGYFTVRTFNDVPYNPNDEKYYFLGDTINNNKIIYMLNRNDIPSIISVSDTSIGMAKSIRESIEMVDIYDGSNYPKTYKYIYNKKNRISIHPVDTLIVEMLGQRYVNFENSLKNKS